MLAIIIVLFYWRISASAQSETQKSALLQPLIGFTIEGREGYEGASGEDPATIIIV